jgi:hypothetical protein
MNAYQKNRILASFLFFLSGCSAIYSESQNSCISGIESKLKSPSSLELIRVSSMENFFYLSELERQYDKPNGSLKLSEFSGQKGVWVRIDMIEYDASNSYGAMLRENEHCHTVPLKNGTRENLTFASLSSSVDIPQERIRVTGF